MGLGETKPEDGGLPDLLRFRIPFRPVVHRFAFGGYPVPDGLAGDMTVPRAPCGRILYERW